MQSTHYSALVAMRDAVRIVLAVKAGILCVDSESQLIDYRFGEKPSEGIFVAGREYDMELIREMLPAASASRKFLMQTRLILLKSATCSPLWVIRNRYHVIVRVGCPFTDDVTFYPSWLIDEKGWKPIRCDLTDLFISEEDAEEVVRVMMSRDAPVLVSDEPLSEFPIAILVPSPDKDLPCNACVYEKPFTGEGSAPSLNEVEVLKLCSMYPQVRCGIERASPLKCRITAPPFALKSLSVEAEGGYHFTCPDRARIILFGTRVFSSAKEKQQGVRAVSRDTSCLVFALASLIVLRRDAPCLVDALPNGRKVFDHVFLSKKSCRLVSTVSDALPASTLGGSDICSFALSLLHLLASTFSVSSAEVGDVAGTLVPVSVGTDASHAFFTSVLQETDIPVSWADVREASKEGFASLCRLFSDVSAETVAALLLRTDIGTHELFLDLLSASVVFSDHMDTFCEVLGGQLALLKGGVDSALQIQVVFGARCSTCCAEAAALGASCLSCGDLRCCEWCDSAPPTFLCGRHNFGGTDSVVCSDCLPKWMNDVLARKVSSAMAEAAVRMEMERKEADATIRKQESDMKATSASLLLMNSSYNEAKAENRKLRAKVDGMLVELQKVRSTYGSKEKRAKAEAATWGRESESLLRTIREQETSILRLTREKEGSKLLPPWSSMSLVDKVASHLNFLCCPENMGTTKVTDRGSRYEVAKQDVWDLFQFRGKLFLGVSDKERESAWVEATDKVPHIHDDGHVLTFPKVASS